MKTLVLGIGNPILSDDSAGLRVARTLGGRLNRRDITVMETALGGLSLVEVLAGYDKAIIVDAIQSRDGKVGEVYELQREALDATRHAGSFHDVNFATALELGIRLGLALPRQISIFAIEVEDVTTFSERCTREVERVIPVVTDMVIQKLDAG